MRMWIVAKWIRIEWMWVEKKDKISRFGKKIIKCQEDLANIMPVTTELPIAPMVATASPVPAQVVNNWWVYNIFKDICNKEKSNWSPYELT